MGLFGFTSFADMFDGGGAGASGGPSSFRGSSLEGLFGGGQGTTQAGGGGGGGGGSRLLSGIGSILGGIVGGPVGAAIGAGLGSLAGGASVNTALRTGADNFLLGSIGGPGANLLNTAMGGTPGSVLQAVTGIPAGQGAPGATPQGAPGQAPMSGILSILNSPLVMAGLLKATEPKNINLTSSRERRMMETGERLPDYRGTPAFDYRYGSNFAQGGSVRGPGTGTSDSIPARIYQNGRPVQEARLSDGEFVMTNRAVRGAGNGDRAKGAAEMYRMMRQFERRA